MKESMYIGSGDISALLAKHHTKGHHELLKRFVSGVCPVYNAEASPIDPARIGAILENRYLLTLPDNYFAQYKVQSQEMDVFRASLDFAKIEGGKVVDFDELKSVYFDDFLLLVEIKDNIESLLDKVKKHYKLYYNQVQQQLYCTGLESCNIVFLAVYNYDDQENSIREIQENEIIKIRIHSDSEVIERIKERGRIFQQIKDYYNNK